MVNRVHYLIHRASAVPRALVSPTGVAAVLAFASGVAALFVGGSITRWIAVVSLVLWLVVALMLSDRIRIISERSRPTATAVASGSPRTANSRSASLEEIRVASARRVLSQMPPAPIGEARRDETPDLPARVDAPLVSIVVPCFNDSRYLSDCLESVQRQTYQDWECIIVDDASRDDSVATAWKFARHDKRFLVVRHTRNGGLSAARNTGLRLASGELISFLDSDDFLTSESLMDRVSHMLPHFADASVAGVFCGVTPAPEDASPADYEPARSVTRPPVDFVSSGDHCPFNVHAVLLRRSVVVAAGGFDESMRHGAEDWDLWYRIMRNGYRFESAGLVSAIYRQKSSSMRQRHALEHFREAQRLTVASQQQAPDGVFYGEAVFPLRYPKGRYEILTRLARRSVQSAATSILAGDEDGAIATLEAVEPLPGVLFELHVNPNRAVADGFRRFLGLTAKEFSVLEPQMVPSFDHMRQLIDVHVPMIAPAEAESSTRKFDILFVPQTGFHLRTMLEVAQDSRLRLGVVDVSLAAGDQGVADALATHPPHSVAVLSYNEALLQPVESLLVVLSYPWDGAVDELASHLAHKGAKVVNLRTDLEDVLRLPEAPGRRVDVQGVATEDLAKVCSTADFETLLDTVQTSPEATFETAPLSYSDAAAAWTIEENPALPFDAHDMERFRGIHAGERVVIIGNGPSLNDLDLSLLEGTATFGVNGIFYADDRLPEKLTYYVVEDTMVMRDNLERIRSYDVGHRFFPSTYRDMIGEGPNSTFFMMNRGFYAAESPAFCVPRFSTDSSQRVYAGQSVTIMNLQLAYYMGFSEVILIGMDFSYIVPESSQVEGVHITSMGDDPNHFHPDYFGKGKVWKDPKLDRALASYALAKQMYEADGRKIINATPGGNLHLFDRVPFEEVMGP